MYIDIKSWLTIISERNDVTLNGNQQIEQKQWRSFINELSKLVVFDQPFEKYANVKMGSFSQIFGVNIKKCLSCHSLVSKIFINLFVLGAWFSYPIKSKTMSTLPQTNSPWKRPICYSFSWSSGHTDFQVKYKAKRSKDFLGFCHVWLGLYYKPPARYQQKFNKRLWPI